jgi:hypothetical protein
MTVVHRIDNKVLTYYNNKNDDDDDDH